MQLHVPHVRVDTVSRDQLVVRALLCRNAILEHNNVVRVTDGAEPVSDHQNGAIRAKPIQSVLDTLLRDCIQS